MHTHRWPPLPQWSHKWNLQFGAKYSNFLPNFVASLTTPSFHYSCPCAVCMCSSITSISILYHLGHQHFVVVPSVHVTKSVYMPVICWFFLFFMYWKADNNRISTCSPISADEPDNSHMMSADTRVTLTWHSRDEICRNSRHGFQSILTLNMMQPAALYYAWNPNQMGKAWVPRLAIVSRLKVGAVDDTGVPRSRHKLHPILWLKSDPEWQNGRLGTGNWDRIGVHIYQIIITIFICTKL